MARNQKVMARRRLEDAALKISLVASQAMAGKIDLSRAEVTKLLDDNMTIVKYIYMCCFIIFWYNNNGN